VVREGAWEDSMVDLDENKLFEIPRGYRGHVPTREESAPYLRPIIAGGLEDVGGLVAGLVPLWLSNQWGTAPYSELFVIPLSDLKSPRDAQRD
jgi:hypothetical protein